VLFGWRRRGAFGMTTGSSICRSSNSRNRSKSFICTRNGYLKRSTHGPQQRILEGLARKSGGAPPGLHRGGLEARGCLGAPSGGVEHVEIVVAFAQLVGELDHLKTQRSRPKAFRRQDDKRPEDHPPTGSGQRSWRNHRIKTTSLLRGVLAPPAEKVVMSDTTLRPGSGSSYEAAGRSPLCVSNAARQPSTGTRRCKVEPWMKRG